MKRERWANNLIIGIICFFFALPVGLILTVIFNADPVNLFLSMVVAFGGPVFGFVMIIVGVVQFIAKKGEK